jgi:hypothetical protein
MNKLLLDYAITKNYNTEVNDIANIVGCKVVNVEELDRAIESFISKNLPDGVSLKYFLIRLLQLCYDVDYQTLSNKTINSLIFMVSLEKKNIEKQFQLLKEKFGKGSSLPSSLYIFEEIVKTPERNLYNLLNLFEKLGTLIGKLQDTQTQKLSEESKKWNKRNFDPGTFRISDKEHHRKPKSNGCLVPAIVILILITLYAG